MKSNKELLEEVHSLLCIIEDRLNYRNKKISYLIDYIQNEVILRS
jgi:hypothetical protein